MEGKQRQTANERQRKETDNKTWACPYVKPRPTVACTSSGLAVCKWPRSTALSLPWWWRHPHVSLSGSGRTQTEATEDLTEAIREGLFVRREYYYYLHRRLWNKHAFSSPSFRITAKLSSDRDIHIISGKQREWMCFVQLLALFFFPPQPYWFIYH